MLAKLEPNWILIKSIDCGDEAAEWLNTCLRKSSLRLIRAEYEITDKSILNRNDVLILNEEDVENWPSKTPAKGTLQIRTAFVYGSFLWIIHYGVLERK
ncbi:PREDICTED: uncharacterized protein LOC105570956 isoform X2 [Vollenhovia emeryi]|uniref:uncharacterized protein LOC105570956 isoform X2 n=1 Tax=Vollenhovia emeryi TaxID=411798 RepID=UPI0005F505A0|nr:PREDICTED: uncharacterized protein LOC105570956 isoform X2 [Vollenhovia emeryi]